MGKARKDSAPAGSARERQGCTYKRKAKSCGGTEPGTSGRSTEEAGDNITPAEERARGPHVMPCEARGETQSFQERSGRRHPYSAANHGPTGVCAGALKPVGGTGSRWRVAPRHRAGDTASPQKAPSHGQADEGGRFGAVLWENPMYGILEGLQETEHGGVLRHRQPKGAETERQFT
jgi:hypothetical protein